jgi:eukaryotic-like serine/threonine-protein kinase
MSLTSSSRLGPYEIITMLGAGGMGEVYRARDSRLSRDVAIKVLPPEVSRDPERLRRFELEARAAASLNHPNILTVHEIGSHNGQPYVVSELLEGQTLRSILSGSALPVKQAADYGIQIATGLAAAHEKGIVHRDVKPENLFVTSDGRLKILDFGLAKLTESVPPSNGTSDDTQRVETLPGIVFGTAGYMSPEQVRGQPVDHRTDIFAFGCVFYEMLSGQRAFKSGAPAETMAAILNDEPNSPSSVNAAVPRGFDRVTQRCLEKPPAVRFQSAKDVAFAIDAVSSWSAMDRAVAASSGAAASPRVNRRWMRVLIPSAAVALVAVGAMFDRLSPTRRSSMPRVTRLTFERGTVSSARFTTDGKTVVYGARWGGEPTRIFQMRLGTPESTAVQLPDADLLAISAGGELAISPNRLNDYSYGTLARAPLVGGLRRDVLEDVTAADWSHDGTQLAVVRRVNGRDRLEYPVGKVLYESVGNISDPRIAPQEDAIAFLDHQQFRSDCCLDEAHVMLTSIGKESKRLGPAWPQASGLSWSADGREVWFTAGDSAWFSDASLRSVSRDGVVRQIWSVPLGLTLRDIAADGRALLTGTTTRNYVALLSPELSSERDVSWFSLAAIQDLSTDGRSLLLTRQDEGVGRNREVGLRSLAAWTAVRLGPGHGVELSSDGRWALALLPTDPTKLLLLPTGAGESREISTPGFTYLNAGWFPDGKRVAFVAKNGTELPAAYVQDLNGGAPRRVASDVSFGLGTGAPLRVSPDGKWLTGPQKGGPPVLLPLDGGEPKHLPTLTADDRPLNWSTDGSAVFVERAVSDKRWATSIVRYDLVTSAITPVRQIEPSDVAGMASRPWCLITADGRVIVYIITRQQSDLYVVDGLK